MMKNRVGFAALQHLFGQGGQGLAIHFCLRIFFTRMIDNAHGDAALQGLLEQINDLSHFDLINR